MPGVGTSSFVTKVRDEKVKGTSSVRCHPGTAWKNEIPVNPRNRKVIHKYQPQLGAIEKPAVGVNLRFMGDGNRSSIILWPGCGR